MDVREQENRGQNAEENQQARRQLGGRTIEESHASIARRPSEEMLINPAEVHST